MKWLRTIVLFDKGDLISGEDWKSIHDSYQRSILSIEHPVGAGSLTLRRKIRTHNNQWQRNGVGYLRSHFLSHIVGIENWKAEQQVDLLGCKKPPTLTSFPSREEYQEPITSEFGGFDLVTTASNGTRVAIEWETGNISSSHRSMNKLVIALSAKIITVGVLIVPSRACYEHLTDRIGNIGELSGYLSLWAGLKSIVDVGLLAITVVEHDHLTDDSSIPFLSVGNDGRAEQGRARK